MESAGFGKRMGIAVAASATRSACTAEALPVDADATSKRVAFGPLHSNDDARSCEREVYEGLMRGYQDVLDGKTVEAGIAFAKIRAQRGW